MLECVTIENNHLFEGNPLCAQHKLRYESIIQRQKWDVPFVREMEYDAYDNPAAYYLVKRNEAGVAIATTRFYPTDRPYMLQEVFSYLVTKKDLPRDASVWEGSRYCVDQHLPPQERVKLIQELTVGYLEFALAFKIKTIVGVMYPIYWKNIFIKNGWNVEWMGEVLKSEEGLKIVAGELQVSQAILDNVRRVTGISHEVLVYRDASEQKRIAA